MPDAAPTLTVGAVRETFPGEARVALVPDTVAALARKGLKCLIESGAGERAGFADEAYRAKGAEIASRRAEVFQKADILAAVRGLGANLKEGEADLPLLRKGQTLIALLEPLSEPGSCRKLAETGVRAFSLELMPRITRAQSMDVLSSMATVAGYKAVLVAANMLPRMFPLLMTAAGTVAPARVLIIGVGVAGLQAISSARRLGAVVSAYDIRPAVKEQVESLGAKFVELPLEAADAETKGGYAKAMDEEFYRKQRELMTKVAAESDVIITTAAVPGKKAPILVTADMVKRMAPGSLIVDLAAERGGNCELTKPGETVVESGVTITGPLNLPATVPYHASQMFAKNIQTFLLHLVKDGALTLNLEDEITVGTLVTNEGRVVHPQVAALLGGAPTAG
jgi:NAD(P) transhydrogenase subunit alpha